MTNNAKISVIIPVYKVEQYLPECLDSLINQTFQDWQAICVDDGSPDSCGKILEEYASKDNRIKVIHKENGGVSSARNAAYQFIDTPYAMFLDPDDMLHNQTLELAYNNIEETNADILWFDANKFMDGDVVEENKITSAIKIKHHNDPFKFYALKGGVFVSHRDRMPGVVWGKIYKSEYVKLTPFALKVFPGEDNLFTLEITAKVKKLVHLKEELYFYRQRQGSIMHNLDGEKYIENTHKEICEYKVILNRLVEQKISFETLKAFNTYLAERVFFKKLFRPFIKGHKYIQSKEYIDNLINSGIFDFNKMKARFRVMLFLYRRNQIKLSKLLSCL